MKDHDVINMEHADQAGQHILNVLTQVATTEVPQKNNKAKALYAMVASLVRGMQAVTSLVGWPGANFSPQDDRTHLDMYDYINDESKTFACLILARISRENSEITLIEASPQILALALSQTEMIHGSIEGKIDPNIISAVRDFQSMSPADKAIALRPLSQQLQ